MCAAGGTAQSEAEVGDGHILAKRQLAVASRSSLVIVLVAAPVASYVAVFDPPASPAAASSRMLPDKHIAPTAAGPIPTARGRPRTTWRGGELP